MDKIYNFAMGFTGCVLLAVIVLVCGGFNAMQISAPAVFATLGAIALVALAWLDFVFFRDRLFKNASWRNLKATIATVIFFVIILCMTWMGEMTVFAIFRYCH